MMKTARVVAAVSTGIGHTELRELPVPDPGEWDGVLAVEATGVCGSDWAAYTGKLPGRFPMIMGHEVVGTIVAAGCSALETWGVTIGERVAVQEFLPCQRCRACRSGSYARCAATDFISNDKARRYGFTSLSVTPGLWGGYSQLMYLHPGSLVHPVGSGVAAQVATLFVPLSNGFGWVVRQGGLAIGESALVIGPGQHGLGCVVAAHAVGSRWIGTVGLARDHRRLEAARRLGSDDTFVNRDEGGLVGEIVEATDGSLCDVVIDTTPAPSGLDLAVQCAAPGGRVVMAADKTGPCETRTLSAIMRKELRLIGVRGRDPQAVDTALEVIRSGGYPLDVMCTHEFGLTEVDRALRIVGRAQEPDAIHVTVAP